MAVRLRVKELLKEKNISQGKFSRGADIPPNLVRRMVNDPKYIPSLPTLIKAANFLGVGVEDLYYEDNENPAPSE